MESFFLSETCKYLYLVRARGSPRRERSLWAGLWRCDRGHRHMLVCVQRQMSALEGPRGASPPASAM